MKKTEEQRQNDGLAWFSSILRWSLGALFLYLGYLYHEDGAWPALLFGLVLIITGFFRPRRCLDEGCTIDPPADTKP